MDKCGIRRNIHGSWWILNTYQQKSPAVCNQITPSLYEEKQSYRIWANLYQFLTLVSIHSTVVYHKIQHSDWLLNRERSLARKYFASKSG
jgi:hypothetical protein